MPYQKTTFPRDGRDVEAEVIPVDSFRESVAIYNLDDGTVLSMRTVVMQVLRLKDRWDKQGNPEYVIRSQNLIAVDSPDELKKKAAES